MNSQPIDIESIKSAGKNSAIQIARSHGIVDPALVWQEAEKVRIPFSCACASLLMESYGGRNIFGADPTSSIPNSWKDGKVTRLRYHYYKLRRRRYGAQGVGPTQLTSPALQDEADRLGGCWNPAHNLFVGFRFLHTINKEQHGNWELTFRRYNGSGPMADRYGRRAIELARTLHREMTR